MEWNALVSVLEEKNKKIISQNTGFQFKKQGCLICAQGLTVEARGFEASIGSRCYIEVENQLEPAVITGFSESGIYLMPLKMGLALSPKMWVHPGEKASSLPVGEALLGRVLDGSGQALDKLGPIESKIKRSLWAPPRNPLDIMPVTEVLDVGVKAINGLLTVGKGQRLGLFAGSGVGKSVLLGMLARLTEADVIVVALIGERNREVKEFLDYNLKSSLKKSVVIASPADYSPLLRLQGAWYAMSIAEQFRDEGKSVLFLFDSLTRFSQAQREIGLGMGEPPATRGYPPSAFAILPQLVERAGNGNLNSKGSITAIFTVLAEGDDQQDPIVDSARAILDGHIVLSREYADKGHYPAIDIELSISRVMSHINSEDHLKQALLFKKYYALYRENKDMIAMGAYVAGSNPDLDVALQKNQAMDTLLTQGMYEKFNFNDTVAQMQHVLQ
ncbi:MAG: FliI/YscN family ATPase [Gammaproteobacteria bacterium]